MERHVRAPETKLELRNEHLFILKLLESTENRSILADFIPAYYLDVFKETDRLRYKDIVNQLLDHRLIKFFTVGDKTYMEITGKGVDFIAAVDKME